MIVICFYLSLVVIKEINTGMIIEENLTFEQYYVLQEGFSDILKKIKSYGVKTVDLLKAINDFHTKGIKEIFFTTDRKTAAAARIVFIMAYSLLAIKGGMEFNDVVNIKNDNEKVKMVSEFLVKHPEQQEKILDAVQKELEKQINSTGETNPPKEELSSLKSDVSKQIDLGGYPVEFINKVKYYESGGVPRKKYWDVNAFRSGYGTYWNASQPIQMSDKEATAVLISELKQKETLVRKILSKYNLSREQLLPFIDIAFNAGEGAIINAEKTTELEAYKKGINNPYKLLVKNAINSAYVKFNSDTKKLNKQILKRRLDMFGKLNLSTEKPEESDKLVDNYIKTHNIEIYK